MFGDEYADAGFGRVGQRTYEEFEFAGFHVARGDPFVGQCAELSALGGGIDCFGDGESGGERLVTLSPQAAHAWAARGEVLHVDHRVESGWCEFHAEVIEDVGGIALDLCEEECAALGFDERVEEIWRIMNRADGIAECECDTHLLAVRDKAEIGIAEVLQARLQHGVRKRLHSVLFEMTFGGRCVAIEFDVGTHELRVDGAKGERVHCRSDLRRLQKSANYVR